MLAIFSSLDFSEMLIIAAGAVIVFGRDLPQVVMRGMAQVMKLRKAVSDTWREAGLEQELRKIRQDVERDVPRHAIPRSAHELLTSRSRPTPAVGAPTEGDVTRETAADPLARERLDREPGAAPAQQPEDTGGVARDLGHGPSEEERRAESGKDLAGHPAPTPTQEPDDVPPDADAEAPTAGPFADEDDPHDDVRRSG